MPKDFEELEREKIILESAFKILLRHDPIAADTVLDRIKFIEKELENGKHQNPQNPSR